MIPADGAASLPTNDEKANLNTSEVRGFSFGFVLLISLAVYFGLHVLTRSFVSHNLQLDEAEQLVLTQDWRWGYGSQPPLYNWIQNALFNVLGVNVFALSLLKNLSLWAAYAFTFLAAREILNSARLAALATAAMLFFPQIAWESQRDQSHLVLATTFAAATLYIYIRLLKKQQAIWYLLLGATAALGFLAKYNYMLLPVALICASLTIREFRGAILNWKVLLTAIAFAVLTAPHLAWIMQNKTAVASQSYKFMTTGLIAPKSPFAGVLQVFKAYLGMAVVPLLIFSPLLAREYKAPARSWEANEASSFLTLLKRAFIAGVILCLVLVVAFRVTYLRDRWVQPLLFAMPILLISLLRTQIQPRHAKRIFGLATVVAIFVLTAINVTVFGANAIKRAHNLNVPYPAFYSELQKTGFDSGTIIANGFLLGGNLKNQCRACRVIVPEMDDVPPSGGPTLIAWSGRTEDAQDWFLDYAARLVGRNRTDLQPRFVDVPCENGKRRSEKFGFILVNAGSK